MLFHMSEITDLIHLTKFEPITISWEIFLFAILGILSGLLGSAFVYTASKLIYLRSHMAYPKIHSRYRYTLIVTLVCAIVAYSAPFLQLSDKAIINQMFRAERLSNYEQLYWSNPSTIFNLALYVVIKLLLTALSISCQIPCGVVAPVFTGGAAFGRLFGYIVDMILGTEHKGVYAVVGAASFVSSITHTLSMAIIVFELTGQINYILPMMVGVLIAYSVSSAISMSMYNVILKMKNLPYLPSIKPSSLYAKTVHDLSSTMICIMKISNIRKISNVIHNAQSLNRVPLVNAEGYLIGEVAVDTLKKFIIEHYLMNSAAMSPEDKFFLNEHVNPLLNSSKDFLEYWKEDDESLAVSNFLNEDLEIEENIIDWAPISIPEGLSLIKVQFMFIMMGLFQISVVNKGKFIGVISRDSFT